MSSPHEQPQSNHSAESDPSSIEPSTTASSTQQPTTAPESEQPTTEAAPVLIPYCGHIYVPLGEHLYVTGFMVYDAECACGPGWPLSRAWIQPRFGIPAVRQHQLGFLDLETHSLAPLGRNGYTLVRTSTGQAFNIGSGLRASSSVPDSYWNCTATDMAVASLPSNSIWWQLDSRISSQPLPHIQPGCECLLSREFANCEHPSGLCSTGTDIQAGSDSLRFLSSTSERPHHQPSAAESFYIYGRILPFRDDCGQPFCWLPDAVGTHSCPFLFARFVGHDVDVPLPCKEWPSVGARLQGEIAHIHASDLSSYSGWRYDPAIGSDSHRVLTDASHNNQLRRLPGRRWYNYIHWRCQSVLGPLLRYYTPVVDEYPLHLILFRDLSPIVVIKFGGFFEIITNLPEMADLFAFSEDDNDSLAGVALEPIMSNAVADRATLTLIDNRMKSPRGPLLGVDDATRRLIYVKLAIYCAHNGSSAKQFSEDRLPLAAQNNGQASTVEVQKLINTIRSICTLRQFCMAYAKIVWNALVTNNTPPARWQKKGFTEAAKFAGFDFFNGVTDPTAINPVGGLVREPTEAELVANQANRVVNIQRSRQADYDRSSTTYAEYTGGRVTGGHRD